MEDRNYLKERLDLAIAARTNLIDANYTAALRLFSGFYEGYPGLAADIYGRTLVLHAFREVPESTDGIMAIAQMHLLEKLPWIECVLQKLHSSSDENLRRGKITFGDAPSNRVREHGVWYATNLRINQDASFYLDTRGLRQWLIYTEEGGSSLNLFAYTGALGVASLAGGARRVVQVDRSHKFMALALRSCQLNQLELEQDGADRP